jgi:hypothetical protein
MRRRAARERRSIDGNRVERKVRRNVIQRRKMAR